MRAKLDENMPSEAVELVVAVGWTCETVRDEGLGGADDTDVGKACRLEARVLFTLDLDFADIRAYPPEDYIGIVVLRPLVPSRRLILQTDSRSPGVGQPMGRAPTLDRRARQGSGPTAQRIGCLAGRCSRRPEWAS